MPNGVATKNMEPTIVNSALGADVPKIAGAATDVGCVREHNEDSHGMLESLGLYVVCDGMGGALGGEVASQMAVEGFLGYIRTHSTGVDVSNRELRIDVLAGAVKHTNQGIFSRGNLDPLLHGMGSTLVGAWFFHQEALLTNVGDSRAYLIRGNELRELTEDHSLVAEQVRLGTITLEEAANSPMSSVITRALGARETVEPDFYLLETFPGDRVLLTSDGLLRHVPDELILSTAQQGTPHEACSQLIQLARQGGGSDNITCIIVQA
jgi:protein phosphatase